MIVILKRRMSRPLLVMVMAMSVLSGVGVRTADNVVVDRFSSYLDSLRIQAGIPGLAATIVSETGVAWEHGFGLQDVEHNVAVRPDTPFQIDGLTQIIVASLVLRCADSGWLSL